jgi:predicted RNA-binding protein with PUA-like domain
MNYWLLKTEPDTFGVDTLAMAPKKTTCWDGIRNYQARNMLRDQMRINDRALLYHSSCEVPGAVAILKIVRAGYPDNTAFDARHKHFDPDSDPMKPRWFMVDVQLERRLKRIITLNDLRAHAQGSLKDFWLLRAGNRLSVIPISAAHWKFILSLDRKDS